MGLSACAIGGSSAATHCSRRIKVAKQKGNSFYLSVVLNLGQVNNINPVIRCMHHALIWLEKGYREEIDLLAVTALVASLDAMSGGGQKDGIRTIVENLLKMDQNSRLFRGDEETLKQFISKIYHTVRNKTLHGFGREHMKDWNKTRIRADNLIRLIFLKQVERLARNPSINSCEGLRTF